MTDLGIFGVLLIAILVALILVVRKLDEIRKDVGAALYQLNDIHQTMKTFSELIERAKQR